jgi:Na+-driven multidrug efflux pump
MMLSFEWWIFEILAILAGLISVEALAAEVIIVNFVTFMFMIPLGCSFAASAFTGFFCASGKIKEAKKYTRLTVAFGAIMTLLALGLMFAF